MGLLTLVSWRIKRGARLFAAGLPGEFSLHDEDRIDIHGRFTPVLRNGGRILNLDFQLPDAFTARTGMRATVFVRQGDDFVRITTSVRKLDGQRAVGTTLDRSQAAYRRAIRGEPYIGYATLFGRRTMTHYKPVRGHEGRVIAILYVGLDVTDLPGLSISAKSALAAGSACALAHLGFHAAVDMPLAQALALAALACTAVGTAAYAWTRRMITGPLVASRQAAQRLADGDLTSQLDVATRDEIGQLLLAINSISVGLTGLVGSVRQAADQVSAGTREIADGNVDLAQRTELQSGDVNATASAMEQLTGTVAQTADRASQANALVGSVSRLAETSSQRVGQVVATMDRIKRGSHRISDIVGLIDGIAFQTNLLALNAAVEAARAGVHGRGFAVVAEEVRGLAGRAASAAREIGGLTTESAQMTDAGGEQVEGARNAMNEISRAIGEVASFVEGIAVASNQQRETIVDVNRSIVSIEQTTQQNAALVEQSAAAAMKIREQAGRLESAVNSFKMV